MIRLILLHSSGPEPLKHHMAIDNHTRVAKRNEKPCPNRQSTTAVSQHPATPMPSPLVFWTLWLRRQATKPGSSACQRKENQEFPIGVHQPDCASRVTSTLSAALPKPDCASHCISHQIASTDWWRCSWLHFGVVPFGGDAQISKRKLPQTLRGPVMHRTAMLASLKAAQLCLTWLLHFAVPTKRTLGKGLQEARPLSWQCSCTAYAK